MTPTDMKTADKPIRIADPFEQLLAMCREIHFGRIGPFDIHDGRPVLDPLPEIVREIRFNGESAKSGRKTETAPPRKQNLDLLKHVQRIHDGHVCYLEVKHGLPFKMNVRHSFGARSVS